MREAGFGMVLLVALGFCVAQGQAQERSSGFVETDGERIYYESYGTGEAIVLSHGLGGNHAIWYQQVPAFAQDYRVITWDQRGFGRSTNDARKASPATAATDLKTLLDHLVIDRAHLVGQSMGGWAVLQFTIDHPERVASLTMADTIGGIYTPIIAEHFDAYIKTAQQSPPPNELPLGRHPAVGEQLSAEDVAKGFLYSQIGSVAEPAPRNMGMLLRTTVADLKKVHALKVPTLFIVGTNDPIFVPAAVREAAMQIPGAQVKEIPASGHSPYFERPEEWNKALREFVGSIP